MGRYCFSPHPQTQSSFWDGKWQDWEISSHLHTSELGFFSINTDDQIAKFLDINLCDL